MYVVYVCTYVIMHYNTQHFKIPLIGRYYVVLSVLIVTNAVVLPDWWCLSSRRYWAPTRALPF